MDDVVDEAYVDIDQTPKASQTAGLGLGLEASVLGSGDQRSVPAFDLSDRSDEREPQTKTWIGGRAVSEVDLSELQDEEDIGLQVRGLSSILGEVLTILGTEYSR